MELGIGTRVALIDDHPMIRRGLESTLASAGFRVAYSGSNAKDLLRESPEVDAVLLDLYLGENRPHFEDVTAVSRRYPVLVMSASARPGDVSNAVAAGAQGYITKAAEDDEVIAAIKEVASGGFPLSSELADALHDSAMKSTAPELSQREMQALRLIAEGFTHRQSASRLGVTVSTFDTYIKRIRQKLGVGNKAELTRSALSFDEGSEPADPH